jgi:hypothetical protein
MKKLIPYLALSLWVILFLFACQDTHWKYRVTAQKDYYWTNEIKKDSSGCIQFFVLRGFNDSTIVTICGTYEIQTRK